ncbi:DUF975 family protein [Clostridium fungisolvens]|uniref:DUF975 family protein n=1 Tax=Clostridium fungisolvens TaxID=1604897 RepID=A0A6V8SB46_9CLOT|nr:DUF975 family protein [Clostridium fungisolvens]GFP74457.1 hypothetical protein bsdtw1_00508 [Clostridium fungisolvens]
MWTRKELKDRAKAVLSKIYLSALGVSIVIALAGGSTGWSGGGGSHSRNGRNDFYSGINNGFLNNAPNDFHSSIPNVFPIHYLFPFLLFGLVAFLGLIALRIFIGYSLEVGGRRYFIKSAQYKDNKGCFGFGFNGYNYGGIVKTMLVTKIFIFLWTLLLIIPGIIKSYAYSMVPYILADNPNIGVKKAIALSNEMTRGHKFDMFVLDLSFIGWYLLGALAFGIGIIFVLPYQNATSAELYLVLRRNALNSGFCTYEDLLLDQPEPYDNMW